jgi:hypothetical protein
MAYSPSQYDKWQTDIFAGNTTIDDLKNKVKTDAASAYPAYADQIMKGTAFLYRSHSLKMQGLQMPAYYSQYQPIPSILEK